MACLDLVVCVDLKNWGHGGGVVTRVLHFSILETWVRFPALANEVLKKIKDPTAWIIIVRSPSVVEWSEHLLDSESKG